MSLHWPLGKAPETNASRRCARASHRISLVRPVKLCQAKLGRGSVPRRSRLDPLHASALAQRRSTFRICGSPVREREFESFSRYPTGLLQTPYFPPFLESGDNEFSNRV